MDINEFTNRFQDFEKNIHSEDLKIWDIVRFDIFFALFYSNDSLKQRPPRSYRNIFLHFILFFNFLFSLRKSYTFLFFSCSRFQNKEHKQYDPNILDIYEILKNNSLCIDSYFSNTSYQYPVVFDYFLKFKYRFCIKKYKKKVIGKFPFYIQENLYKEFGIKIEDDFICNLLAKFELEKRHYFKLFRHLRPKAIFLVQNGIQKGLFMAARECNIPLIELQHGLVDYSHLAYSYPLEVEVKELILPSYFFVYSEFWKNRVNYPVKGIITVGNTHASKIEMADAKIYDICIVCADIYMSEFFAFVDGLLAHNYKGEICLKLHPNQLTEIDFIQNKYRMCSNVHIVYTEISMKRVLSLSHSMIAIQSTSVYEALDAGVSVFILKKLDYCIHGDIFMHPLVKLVDNIDDFLFSKLENKINKSSMNFFDRFDCLKFEKFMNENIYKLNVNKE